MKIYIINRLIAFASVTLTILLVKNPLVMIVYGNGEGYFSIVLTDNVFIKCLFDLLRLWKGIDSHSVKLRRGFSIFINKLFTGIYTEIAYINSCGGRNQEIHLIFLPPTERAISRACIHTVSCAVVRHQISFQ